MCGFLSRLPQFRGSSDLVKQGDDKNWSCCYDSLFTVLYSIWVSNPKIWTKNLRKMNMASKKLASGFRKFNNSTFVTVRNDVRNILHQMDCVKFPYGAVRTSMPELTNVLATTDNEVETTFVKCNQCNENSSYRTNAHFTIQPQGAQFTSDGLQRYCKTIAPYPCKHCGNHYMSLSREFNEQPELILFTIGENNMSINAEVQLPGKKMWKLKLRGIVY